MVAHLQEADRANVGRDIKDDSRLVLRIGDEKFVVSDVARHGLGLLLGTPQHPFFGSASVHCGRRGRFAKMLRVLCSFCLGKLTICDGCGAAGIIPPAIA
jgi:hypothetical protein